LAVPTKKTERSGLSCPFTGVGRGAATLWVSTLASDAAAREVDGESKRVYRLYREEGLAMRRRKGKRFRAEARVLLALPARANQMWTMDLTIFVA